MSMTLRFLFGFHCRQPVHDAAGINRLLPSTSLS